MNLADPELELIDPTPNVHSLFIHFDKVFFWTKLASRAVVKWSKRMYSCAGVCTYEGRGGLCIISLSEPLLKLRPRKDLIETLLHEMIHAYLFVTCRDQDRDGHGPNFKAHMHRINKIAGLNITIYHDFHDEVELYLTHWWRCNGPCQTRKPLFGIVRRFMNKAPGPSDHWWERHKRNCGGTFIKIKEPNKPTKSTKKTATVKPKADITKYITNQKTNISTKPVLKDSNTIPFKTKTNGPSTLVITKKEPILNPQVHKSPVLFSGKGNAISNGRPRANSVGVTETVRNIWANKQLPVNTSVTKSQQITDKSKLLNNTANVNNKIFVNNNNNISNPNKHKSDSHITSPPAKFKKIDDYFKKSASTTLKDVYGQDFMITQISGDQKFTAVPIKVEDKSLIQRLDEISVELVDCPICNAKLRQSDINTHLDECLNREVIDTLCKDNQVLMPQTSTCVDDKKNLRNIVGNLPLIPAFKGTSESIPSNHRLSNQVQNSPQQNINTFKDEELCEFDSNDINKVKEIVRKINHDKEIEKYNVTTNERKNRVVVGDLPSIYDELAVKIEPGTSKSEFTEQKCACCGKYVDKQLEEHLEECLAFFSDTTTIPETGASTSFSSETIVIDDDDDIFDETLTLNATGTKSPCPCCLKMIEGVDMNAHLDLCLA